MPMRHLLLGLLLGGARVHGSEDAGWTKCERSTCTCAGACLASLGHRTFEATDAEVGANMTYHISLCDPLPLDKPPTEGGSLNCDGCGEGHECTIVRDVRHTSDGNQMRECLGLGGDGKDGLP